MKPSAVELLLHLAGQLPDELLEFARDRLAVGDLPEVGRLVRFGHAAYGCTVPPDCYDIARELFVAADAPEAEVATLVFPRTPMLPYEFWSVADGKISRPVDLTGGTDSAGLLADERDREIVACCEQVPGLHSVWRAWRDPLGNAFWPPRTRMVIAEVGANADPLEVRDVFRAAAGLPAVVEVLRAGARVPVYHQRARAASALLWVAGARRQQEVAPEIEVPSPPSRRADGQRIWPSDYVGYLLRAPGWLRT